MKKTFILIVCSIAISFMSCKKRKFLDIAYDDARIQMCIRPYGILKSTNIGENGGMETLQLFDRDFNLVEETPLYSVMPFAVSKWHDGIIEITCNTDSYSFYKYWLDSNKYKPVKIGKYKIQYTCQIDKGGNSRNDYDIDSILIDKEELKVYLFSNGHSLNKIKLDSLSIHRNKIGSWDFSKKTYSAYYPKNEHLITKLMDDIFKVLEK